MRYLAHLRFSRRNSTIEPYTGASIGPSIGPSTSGFTGGSAGGSAGGSTGTFSGGPLETRSVSQSQSTGSTTPENEMRRLLPGSHVLRQSSHSGVSAKSRFDLHEDSPHFRSNASRNDHCDSAPWRASRLLSLSNAVALKPSLTSSITTSLPPDSLTSPHEPLNRTSPRDNLPTAPISAPISAPSYVPLQIEGCTWWLPDRFRFNRVLGKGAYGCVAEFYDGVRQQKVAIKRVSELFKEPLDSKRILRELKCLRHLKGCGLVTEILDVLPPHCGVLPNFKGLRSDGLHSNGIHSNGGHSGALVTAQLHMGTEDGERRFFRAYENWNELYIVMEAFDCDLQHICRSRAPPALTESQVRFFFFDLLRAFALIHRSGIMHRDVKPSNILVNVQQCALKVCDFGLARRSVNIHCPDAEPTAASAPASRTPWDQGPSKRFSSLNPSDQIDQIDQIDQNYQTNYQSNEGGLESMVDSLVDSRPSSGFGSRATTASSESNGRNYRESPTANHASLPLATTFPLATTLPLPPVSKSHKTASWRPFAVSHALDSMESTDHSHDFQDHTQGSVTPSSVGSSKRDFPNPQSPTAFSSIHPHALLHPHSSNPDGDQRQSPGPESDYWMVSCGSRESVKTGDRRKIAIEEDGEEVEDCGELSDDEEGPAAMTEYIITRWYRPPEVLLNSGLYNSRVDVWGVGCIMCEVLLRRAIFPGSDNSDQLSKICDVLGRTRELDTLVSDADSRPYCELSAGESLGISSVSVSVSDDVRRVRSALKMMPLRPPTKRFADRFPAGTDLDLIDLIGRLLILDPSKRWTAERALAHPYFAPLHATESSLYPLHPIDPSFVFSQPESQNHRSPSEVLGRPTSSFIPNSSPSPSPSSSSSPATLKEIFRRMRTASANPRGSDSKRPFLEPTVSTPKALAPISVIDWSFDDIPTSKDAVKAAIYREIAEHYHPEIRTNLHRIAQGPRRRHFDSEKINSPLFYPAARSARANSATTTSAAASNLFTSALDIRSQDLGF